MSVLKTYPRERGILSLDNNNKGDYCIDHLTDSQSSSTLSPSHEVVVVAKERIISSLPDDDDRTKVIDYSGGSPSSIATSGFSSGKSGSSVRSVTRERGRAGSGTNGSSSSHHTANVSQSSPPKDHQQMMVVAPDSCVPTSVYTSSTIKYEGQLDQHASVPYQLAGAANKANSNAAAGNNSRMYKSNSENNGISLARSSSAVTTSARPSTSSWNDSINSAEQESDYVVDPVQGNAYYKGQFLGKVMCIIVCSSISIHLCVLYI